MLSGDSGPPRNPSPSVSNRMNRVRSADIGSPLPRVPSTTGPSPLTPNGSNKSSAAQWDKGAGVGSVGPAGAADVSTDDLTPLPEPDKAIR